MRRPQLVALPASLAWAAALAGGCGEADRPPRTTTAPAQSVQTRRPAAPTSRPALPSREYRVVHVFVALADNRHQGIVPVPAALGNGQDPKGNLYWGAMYGVRTWFARSPHWRRAAAAAPARGCVLDRVVFRGRGLPSDVYVVADAYDGSKMAQALADFFSAAAAGRRTEVPLDAGRRVLHAGGAADLICFVGHNGLMDARPAARPARSRRPRHRAAVVLACKSREYFLAPLRRAGCPPLITTTGLMAPEAYTLEAIVRSWAAGETPARTREAAAAAYAKYQKCGLGAARRLFAAGE